MKKQAWSWQKEFRECGFESKEEFLWIYVMGGCGCGNSDYFQERAWKVFKNFTQLDQDKRFSLYDDKTDELLAHWMDEKGLLDHGGSIGHSWLSDQGEELYNTLKDYTL